jgi:two-component system response regulator NreC
MSIRILLADDHQMVRQGLRALVCNQPDLEVVGEAGDGRATVALAQELAPDVVIMDIGMPDLNGIDATRQILARIPKTKVIALSMHSNSRFVAGMLQAGAFAYLLKDSAFEELVRAIQTVMANQIYLSPGISGVVVRDFLDAQGDSAAGAAPVLSNREREVLQLISEGWSTKEIASRLHLSVKTVETHRQRLMSRLHVRSVAELTKYAILAGLTSLE